MDNKKGEKNLVWDLSGQETVHSECVLHFKEQIVNQSSIPKTRGRKLKCHLNKSTETDMSFWEQSSQHKYQRIWEPRNVNLNATGTLIFCKSHLLKTVSQMTEWYLEKWRSNFISPSWIFSRPWRLKVEVGPESFKAKQLTAFKVKGRCPGIYLKRSSWLIKMSS